MAQLQDNSNTTSPDLSTLKLPKSFDELQSLLVSWFEQILTWAQSPAFLAQIAAIVISFIVAPILAGALRKRVPLFRTAPKPEDKFFRARNLIFQTRTFLRAMCFVALLAVSAAILRATPLLGHDWLVKVIQSLAVIFVLFKAIKQFAPNPLVRKLANWVLLPTALLVVFGYFDRFLQQLESLEVVPSMDINALTLVKLVIFGAIFFWLGGISNHKGQTAIRKQESLDVSTREVVAKLFQIVLFAVLFVLLLSVAGIPLSGLVVIFSALTLGIGLGLQPVAANFVSGLIILFDRSVQVGDFIELPDGQQGYVEAINMRSTTVETTDGKDIMVPNTKFIEEAYQNWTHKDPRQRYEVYFSVAYDTDIDRLEDILIPAVSAHPQVLQEPEVPDLELREFGDFGIKFAIEFWADGIDDGENKFTSDLNFIVWRTLKKHGIAMPLPQQEIRILK